MKCPKCGHEIRETAKFCDECGTNLHLTGSSLESLPGSSKAGVASEPERKHVTALFSDLTGYTSMNEKLDPEQVKEITGRIFTGVKQIVAKYEGFIERVMGDGCLVFFGIPRAHEDDPVRAIHCAMEIHRFVKGLSPQYEARVGAPLAMHSGINTGLVVTADVNPEKGTHGVAGDAVNVASRLSGMAGPGEILVGAETVRRAKGRFMFDDLGQKQAKGKAEPVRVFKVVSAKAHSVASGIDRQVSSEMVGRDKELDKLEFQVMKAINGDGSVANVIGEAGIGKSRLIAELKKSHIMNRVTLLEGRAISIGKNLSFHPIIDLLKQWAGIAEADSESTASDKLEKAIRAVHPEETNEILPFVATLMGMKFTGRHAERVKGIEGESLEKLIFKNVRELVIKGAELRPTVVVMEDLHWADTSSIELLDALFRLAEKHRIAFINVFRPGYFETTDGKIASIGTRIPAHYVEITIQALDKTNSETLIDNILAIRGLPYTVKNQIVERAGGNPFFIEEVVRSLIDEGAVVKRDGGFEVTEKIEKVMIPPTINDVLMARIDRLEERTRELVKVASVIGRSFFDRIIKDVADAIEDVDQRLEYLKDVQLIRDRVRMREVEYVFKHALVQEAAYESTLIQQRKALHRKVAEAIERIFQERLQEFYGMLAYQYSQADDPEKAEEWMVRAGEEALRSSASSEALYYYHEALRFYVEKYGEAGDPEKLSDFEKNIALAHLNKSNWPDAVHYFDRLLGRWGHGHQRGRIGEIAGLVFDLLIILLKLHLPLTSHKRIPDHLTNERFRLSATRNKALIFVRPVRAFTEAIRDLRQSLDYDSTKLQTASMVYLMASGMLTLSGFHHMGGVVLKKAAELVDEKCDQDVTTQHITTNLFKLLSGEWANIPEYDESLFDACTLKGLFWDAANISLWAGILHTYQGNFHQAHRLRVENFVSLEENYQFGPLVQRHLSGTALLVIRGRADLAYAEAEKGVALACRRGLEPWQLAALGWRAVTQVLCKDIPGARDSLGQADRIRRKEFSWSAWYLSSVVLGQFLLDLHLLEEALAGNSGSSLRDRAKFALKSGKAAVKISAKFAPHRTWDYRLMGDYYWLVGKQRKAMKWYDRSIKEGERLGARPDLSRTYFEVGRHLLEPHSKYKQLNGIDAKGYLEKAEILFKEMGLEHDLDELERVRLGT
jgi:class 3 adenylate cyclase/tetratricopeptide (TPR) repeat protein